MSTTNGVYPRTGTEAQRYWEQTEGADFGSVPIGQAEIHTTSDQRRLFLNHLLISGAMIHRAADAAGMFALDSTEARGCWPADICLRADTGHVYLCTGGNGADAVDWLDISATGDSPAWGSMVGTLTDQADLSDALEAKANATDIPAGWVLQWTGYAATSRDCIAANTTPAAFTITLPAAPVSGDWVQIIDPAASWATHALTVDPAGGKIEGSTGTIALSVSGAWLFIWLNSAVGWKKVAMGGSGLPTPTNSTSLGVDGSGSWVQRTATQLKTFLGLTAGDLPAHKSTHATGGSDALAPSDIGAAPLNSPALTGTPTSPTATAGTNTTQIATTQFVTSAIVAAGSIAAPGVVGQIYTCTGVGTAGWVLPATAWQAQVQTYHDRAVASGGTFTANTLNLADALISALNSQTFAGKILWLAPLFGNNLATALIPLVDQYGVGGMVNTNFVNGDFSEITGLQGAAGKRCDTKLRAGTLGSGSNGGLGYWERNFSTAVAFCIGSTKSDNTSYYGIYLPSGSQNGYWGTPTDNCTVSSAPGNNHYYLQRSSATSRSLSKDGTSIATNTTSDSASGATDMNIGLLGDFVSGYRSFPGRCGVAYATDGTLTGTEINDLHSFLNTYVISATGR